jgi:signal transduction histidine kinase
MRTPLAVIQSNLGVVLEHTDQSVIDNLEWIHNAHSESRRLSKLVQDLLTLARSDAEALPVVQQPVDLSVVTAHVAELFSPVMDAAQLRLSTQIQDQVRVLGDEDRLHQLLVILVDNAAKYTPPGGHIHLQLQSSRGLATLSVADTGQGIASEDEKRVFDRFYQADRARAREDSHGAGLGLSIAKWITEAHHGKISLTSELNKGTQVMVQLPVLTQAPKN